MENTAPASLEKKLIFVKKIRLARNIEQNIFTNSAGVSTEQQVA